MLAIVKLRAWVDQSRRFFLRKIKNKIGDKVTERKRKPFKRINYKIPETISTKRIKNTKFEDTSLLREIDLQDMLLRQD